MSSLVTLDLDDTLLHTQQHYDAARNQFAEFVHSKFDIDIEDAKEVQSEASRNLLDSYGLSQIRFPLAMEEALRSLTENPTSEDYAEVREMARNVYKTAQEYRNQGIAHGGYELLHTAKSEADEVWILTAGDPSIQQAKIEGLNLHNQTDKIQIVGMGEKEATLAEARENFDTVIHIGNSSSSDVEAAESADVDCIHIPTASWRNTTEISYNAPSGQFYQVRSLSDAETRLNELLS